jgi:hypothetical protein
LSLGAFTGCLGPAGLGCVLLAQDLPAPFAHAAEIQPLSFEFDLCIEVITKARRGYRDPSLRFGISEKSRSQVIR